MPCTRTTGWISLYSPCGAAFSASVVGRDKRDVIEITQAGGWRMRRSPNDPGTVTYANSRSGTSITWRLLFGRDVVEIVSNDWQVFPPAHKAGVLEVDGERCTVRVMRIGATMPAYESHDCVTRDGIPLVSELGPPRDPDKLGDRLASDGFTGMHVTRLSRKRIPAVATRPPAATFRWTTWGIGVDPADAGAASHEVLLTDETEGRAVTIAIKHVGEAELKVTTDRGAIREMVYQGRDGFAKFYDARDGLRRGLSTAATDPELARRRRYSVPRPRRLAETDTILGEHCQWYDMDPGVQDASHDECRTADDVPLAIRETSWGRPTLLAKAVVLRRGHLQPSDLTPPAQLLSERFWRRR